VDRTRLTRGAEALVAVGTVGSWLATAHTAYNLSILRTPSAAPDPVVERVSVLVPARDEAERIEPCIRALLASTGVADLEVVVLDDGSTDGTADVVRRAAHGDPRLRVLDGGDSPVPDGWLGKTWACHRLAEAATGSVLVFVDADVVLAPHGLAATVGLLRSTGLDLVCPYPRQLADGALPRLVQPLLQWSWATLLPLGLAESSPRESLVAANGQLLAIDAGAYARCGGFETVRREVLDDVALLRALKASGGRGVVADGTEVATCRMYDDAEALVDGYTKSLWSAFGSRPGAAAAVAMLGLLYVVPPLAAVAGPSRGARSLGALGYAAGVAGRALVARRTGGRQVDALAHPLSVALLGALVAESWRRHDNGTLAWRGRPLP
jgi:glycosyltransferase involved in cell wall biosynthesis